MNERPRARRNLLAVAGLAAIRYPPPDWIILIVGVVIAWRAWMWLCRHHPLIAIFIHGFLSGLLGGRGRRRR